MRLLSMPLCGSQPREGGGDLDTRRGDFRWAGGLSEADYLKHLGAVPVAVDLAIVGDVVPVAVADRTGHDVAVVGYRVPVAVSVHGGGPRAEDRNVLLRESTPAEDLDVSCVSRVRRPPFFLTPSGAQ